MKRNYFRIELYPDANHICEAIVLLAAKSNGGGEKLTLETLEQSAKFMLPEGKSTTIIDNSLNIDVLDTTDNLYKLGCVITEVELLEMAKIVEFETEDDIPENLYSHPGIGDN